ncbi:hypothetical protein [Limosilactobacillus reuteri]|jgi:hypothetical protein|uniref:Uncharacterized protein n=1 Tax=Limosilactobacillus reuteri TaxID=1598 RepID=A0A1X8VAQ8_LIMRT|nr:hypothetical protein [Limosilactobacillus reuteri]GFI60507.1 hypothetical protein IMSAG044_01401 [Lactobacillaceae bacterium]ANU52036.1 hypothetical protein A4V07_07100 [Limosilactobacillus reuteri]MBW3350361.1 hypothetical protein [Limosilactobacillus reuteri]MCC4330875.1 hypothetical protein [Limosilactobacillus reuteri]MCC4353116.1 hypothetical protein [Limosilactobacillus reuteri]
MNKTFMSGYYQGVVETAPATLSAAKTEQLAITMTILHLRHAGINITSIHDFLVNDLHTNERLVNKYINLNADELETIQAQVMAIAFNQ